MIWKYFYYLNQNSTFKLTNFNIIFTTPLPFNKELLTLPYYTIHIKVKNL